MKPRGMRSKWVKVRPWYYVQRRRTTRAVEIDVALRDEITPENFAFVCRREDIGP